MGLAAIGAGIAVLTGLGAGIGIGVATNGALGAIAVSQTDNGDSKAPRGVVFVTKPISERGDA